MPNSLAWRPRNAGPLDTIPIAEAKRLFTLACIEHHRTFFATDCPNARRCRNAGGVPDDATLSAFLIEYGVMRSGVRSLSNIGPFQKALSAWATLHSGKPLSFALITALMPVINQHYRKLEYSGASKLIWLMNAGRPWPIYDRYARAALPGLGNDGATVVCERFYNELLNTKRNYASWFARVESALKSTGSAYLFPERVLDKYMMLVGAWGLAQKQAVKNVAANRRDTFLASAEPLIEAYADCAKSRSSLDLKDWAAKMAEEVMGPSNERPLADPDFSSCPSYPAYCKRPKSLSVGGPTRAV